MKSMVGKYPPTVEVSSSNTGQRLLLDSWKYFLLWDHWRVIVKRVMTCRIGKLPKFIGFLNKKKIKIEWRMAKGEETETNK
jgi:hypothetical protein